MTEKTKTTTETLTRARLQGADLTIGYDGRVVSAHLDVEIPAGSFTVVVGPNACGKSTLLRALARLLRPTTGQVLLDGRAISDLPTKEIARRLGLLPQTSLAPDGIRVSDLVARGRHPHQTILRQWSHTDQAAVAAALAATGTTELAGRLVDELSGGQRQRVWVAMLLAQESPTMLLDEPTAHSGTTRGVPACGSGITEQASPKTSSTRSAVTIVDGSPEATISPSRIMIM